MDTPTDHDLQSRIQELERTLDSVERRHAIDLALIDADAIDLESARLLTEVAVTTMNDTDVKTAIADLKKRKPFLFRPRATPPSTAGAMSTTPARRTGGASDESAEAAARAGDRRALLKYLRARRGN